MSNMITVELIKCLLGKYSSSVSHGQNLVALVSVQQTACTAILLHKPQNASARCKKTIFVHAKSQSTQEITKWQHLCQLLPVRTTISANLTDKHPLDYYFLPKTSKKGYIEANMQTEQHARTYTQSCTHNAHSFAFERNKGCIEKET